MPRLNSQPAMVAPQNHHHVSEKISRSEMKPTHKTEQGYDLQKQEGRQGHYPDKPGRKKKEEPMGDASEISLHIDFLTGELQEEDLHDSSRSSEDRFRNNCSDHDQIPVNRSSRRSHSPVDEEIYTRGAAAAAAGLPKKTEHSSDDTKTLPTCSMAGSGSSFYEITIPSTGGSSAVVESHVEYHTTEVTVEEGSYHYSASEQVTYHHDIEFVPRQEDYRGRTADDDRWGGGGTSHNLNHAPTPRHRREDPMSPRRSERVPVQRTLSSNSRGPRRCSQTELASITQPPLSPRRNNRKKKKSRSPSPRPPQRENSHRNSRSAAQNNNHSWYNNSDEVSVTVSVISVSKRGSAAELASVTRPNDGSFSGRCGSANASWNSKGEYTLARKSNFSPNNSFRGEHSFSPQNSFRGRLREELTVHQQSSFRSRSNGAGGDQQEVIQTNKRDSFESTVREEIKVLNRNGAISPQDLTTVLNNSFRRLNQSFKTCSEKGRSPHSSFRGQDMSGLLDESLKLDDDQEQYGPEDTYRTRDEEYPPHQDSYDRSEEAPNRSLRSHQDDHSAYNNPTNNSYRSQRAEERRPIGSHQSSYRELQYDERSAYNPNNNNSYRSHRGDDRSGFNPNNSYRSHRGEDRCSVHSRQSSFRGPDDRSVHSRRNSQRSRRGDGPGPHNSFRSEDHHHAPFGRQGTFPGQQPRSPSNSYHSQRGPSPHNSHHGSHGGESAPFCRQGTYPCQEPRSPATHSRSVRGHNGGPPMYKRENSWKNSANEAQWRNRFEHHRPNFSRENSWRSNRPGYQRESSFGSRNSQGGRPMYQRESSFNSRSDHGGRPGYYESGGGRPPYSRESSFRGQNDWRPNYEREPSFRGQHDAGGYQREASFNNRNEGANYCDHPGSGDPHRESWVDRTPSNLSRYTREEVHYHREEANVSEYSRESFSSYTRETKEVSSFHPHGHHEVPSPGGRHGHDEVPSPGGRRLPPRSKSDCGSRLSRSSRSSRRRVPSRGKSDLSELTELSKGITSVANSYSTRGGGVDGEELLVEVFPGVEVPLRRAHETQEAIMNNFYMPVSCMACCNMDLYAIADVAYFVCPACKTMCNVEADDCFNGQPVERRGLGLGFTSETLFCMQAEIMGARSPARAPTNNALHRCGTR